MRWSLLVAQGYIGLLSLLNINHSSGVFEEYIRILDFINRQVMWRLLALVVAVGAQGSFEQSNIRRYFTNRDLSVGGSSQVSPGACSGVQNPAEGAEYTFGTPFTDIFFNNTFEDFAGRLCVGDHCARHFFGNYVGEACRGFQCAFGIKDGCTDAQFNHAATQQACCIVNTGAGCIGDQCSMNCSNYDCGRACIGTDCSRNCKRPGCGGSCQGSDCARSCVGTSCGQACSGSSCAQNCVGSNCGLECIGDNCAQGCKGDSSYSSTSQSTCGRKCDGYECAKDCYANNCGQDARGEKSAEGCRGKSCGSYCVGKECALNASTNSFGTLANFVDTLRPSLLIRKCVDNEDSGYFTATFALTTALTGAIFTPPAPTTAPTILPSFAPTASTPAPTLSGGLTSAPTASPTNFPTQAPASGFACQVQTATGLPSWDSAVDGAGSFCSGTRCGFNASGTGAAVGCSGDGCGQNTLGLFASLGCTGTDCGRNAKGVAAASFCRGRNCAVGATGTWAGQFCMGNGCGGDKDVCCVGKNCAREGGWSCEADVAAYFAEYVIPPVEADDPTTYTHYPRNQLWEENCGQNVDIEHSNWTTFEEKCAVKANRTLIYTNDKKCTNVRCTEKLHAWLKLYTQRSQVEDYVSSRAEESSRFDQGDDSDDDTLMIVLIVIASAVGLVLLGYAGTVCYQKGRTFLNIDTMRLMNQNSHF